MDPKSILLAYLISQGAHTTGHFYESNKQDVPINFNLKTLSESWGPTNKEQETDINGAGFSMQDKIRNLLPENTKRNESLASALLKGLYLAGVPNKLSGSIQQGGDIDGMSNASGNRGVKKLLLASILADIYAAKNPKSTASVNFATINGAPGLVFNKRF